MSKSTINPANYPNADQYTVALGRQLLAFGKPLIETRQSPEILHALAIELCALGLDLKTAAEEQGAKI